MKANTYRVWLNSGEILYLTRNYDDSFHVRIVDDEDKTAHITLTQTDIKQLNEVIHADDDGGGA